MSGRWTEVDDYLVDRLIPDDDALTAALADSEAAGLAAINVTPTQGRFLNLLARVLGARRVLEVGTLGGYSTIWLGRALPADGHLRTLEVDPATAKVARGNLARAGLADVAEVRVGRAIDLLPTLAAEPPYDLVFIDADKPSNPDYLSWALRLTRPGSVIVVDNVVRGGAVADADSEDPAITGTRRMLDLVAAEPRLDATALQTVGAKGYDGFLVALVTG
jgi:predicted O-methyltransferase YrrM